MSAPSVLPGDAAPWFHVRSIANQRFHFDTCGGRYLLLAFLGSAGGGPGAEAMAVFNAAGALFNGVHAALFAISADPTDETSARLKETGSVKAFWDFDRKVARLYGLADEQHAFGVAPTLFLVDPGLRVLAMRPLRSRADAEAMVDLLRRQPQIAPPQPAVQQAPVLVVDRVFEPGLCKALIDYYERQGAVDSGYMTQVGEKTVGVVDYGHKRRQDCWIKDDSLMAATRARIHRRLTPQIEKAFQFKVTRLERYIVACYDADIGGYFRPHRDNTTTGTAHRRFAVTINLNSEQYQGGDLRFPEYGNRVFRAPTGGAVVFSCGILHEATPVTSGRRYAFLPFLYDDAAAEIRARNAASITSAGSRPLADGVS
ncbi:MAG: 2OG-Fe(II) oxygenase [Reyranellaceae bacterium]